MPQSPRGRRGVHDRRQSEHRHPPDGPAPARPGLLPAPRPRVRRPHPRGGTPRGDPALLRRSDRAQPGRPALGFRCAAQVRHPRARHSPGRDPRDRGPREVRPDHGAGARPDPPQPCRLRVRRGGARRRDPGVSGHGPRRLHPRRQGRWRRPRSRGAQGGGHARPPRQPRRPGPPRTVRRVVQAARVRGRPRCEREHAHRLQHGERAQHARPHRGQHRRCPEPDAHGPRVPDAPTGRAPGGRCVRYRGRVQHPVLSRPGERGVLRDRDQCPTLPLERAREQGHGLPARLRRGEARPRLHPPRTEEPDHRGHHRVLRAVARLRRRQAPAMGHGQVRTRRPPPRAGDEVRRRGDGDRSARSPKRYRRRYG